MKIIHYTICFILLLYGNTIKAEDLIIQKNGEDAIKSVYFNKNEQNVPKTPKDFFYQFLGVDNEDIFRLGLSKSSIRGMSFERYQQFYKGIKVEGGYYSFRFRNGEMIAAKGNYIKIKEINPIPAISENDAIRQFLSFLDIGAYSGKELSISLIIKELTVKEGMQAFLVYKLEMQNPKTRKFETGYIDAHSGRILFHEQKTYCSSAIGTFQTLYNNTVSGETYYFQGTYHLFDSTRGDGIHTFSSPSENIFYEITDNDNNWTANELGSNRMGLDIQWTLEQIYDVLKNSYNHNSYDGHNGSIFAHITPWDNTQFLPYPTSLHFNTGNWYTNPMASIDVIAHEFGHAILYYTCDWTFTGALHEGFADIWGILFEHRINPNKDIWKTGEEIMIGYSCMRNFANPSDPYAYSQIATTYGVNLGSSSDPHVAGGIIPYWFYLLVHGGDALNEAGNHYLVFPMGYDVVEQLIIYTALNPSYLEGCTTYTSVRNAFIEAAEDLGDSFLANQIANAWYAVGIGSSGNTVSISGPSYIYNTSVYGVQNLPSGYAVSWSLSGTNASNFVLQNNSPSANQCTINRNFGESFVDTTNVVLTAQIKHNDSIVTTISKSLITPHISGPTEPCGSNVYRVANLPVGNTVSWSVSPAVFNPPLNPFIVYNSPQQNQCTINNSATYAWGTNLYAYIKNAEGDTISTLVKPIRNTFDLTFSQMGMTINGVTYPSIPETSVESDETIIVNHRCRVSLYSPYFENMTLTHTGATPLFFDTFNGNLSFRFSTVTTTQHMYIYGTDGCKVINLHVQVTPNSNIPIPMLEINPISDGFEILLTYDGEEEAVRDMVAHLQDIEWNLNIANAMSGEKVQSLRVKGPRTIISTIDKKPGVYVLQAIVDGQECSEKITIK